MPPRFAEPMPPRDSLLSQLRWCVAVADLGSRDLKWATRMLLAYIEHDRLTARQHATASKIFFHLEERYEERKEAARRARRRVQRRLPLLAPNVVEVDFGRSA